jgi:hydrogenase maturation protein HypF
MSRIALCGGVFQNLLLRELLIPLLHNDGFEVFLNHAAPPGDGGLAVGQAWFEER